MGQVEEREGRWGEGGGSGGGGVVEKGRKKSRI